MTITHVDAFLVIYLVVDTGITLLAILEAGIILLLLGKGDRQLTRGIYLARDNVGKGRTRLRTKIPALQESLNLTKPWCGIRIAGIHHGDDIRLNLSQFADEFVLSVREFVGETVATLAVLLVVFVHTAYKYDNISLLGLLQSLGLEASLSSCGHHIHTGIHRTTSLITLGEVDSVAIHGLEGFEGRDVALCLELRRTATLTHVADGIVANNEDAAVARSVERQNTFIL